MGVLAGFNFHYVKPRQDLHSWAVAYLIAAPVAFATGLIQYYYFTSDFGSLNKIGNSDRSTFDWMFWITVILSSVSWIPSYIMLVFAFRFSWDEDSASTDEEKLYGDAEGDYGSMFQTFSESVAGPFFSGGGDAESSENQGGSPWLSGWRPGAGSATRSPGAPSETESVDSRQNPLYGPSDTDVEAY